jgi:hypothetical protein
LKFYQAEITTRRLVEQANTTISKQIVELMGRIGVHSVVNEVLLVPDKINKRKKRLQI